MKAFCKSTTDLSQPSLNVLRKGPVAFCNL